MMIFKKTGLVLLFGMICQATVQAQTKTLTIVNDSVLPLTVYLDGGEGQKSNIIGFVDPVSRLTLDYALQNGRWYVTIEPYAPGTRVKSLAFSLYVKEDKNAYVYEVQDRNFSDKTILPPENMSILGKWHSGPWRNQAGLVVEFTRKDGGYTGTIVSCSSELFLKRSGYYIGMELISGLRRVKINMYEGSIKETRRDGTLGDERFSVMIERGQTLFPHGWTRGNAPAGRP